jgi:hypothetical protein
MLSCLVTLILCWAYIKLKPREDRPIDRFRREQVLNYEIQLNHGEFPTVLKTIRQEREKPENQAIRTEIEILENIVTAAHRGCD